MRGVISISEKVADLPLPDGGTAEVCATADGEYNEQEHRLTVTVDSFVRPAEPLDSPVPRPEWLPASEQVKDVIVADEATALVRDVFERWCERVRRAMPEELHRIPTP
jgi:hypothetical protein